MREEESTAKIESWKTWTAKIKKVASFHTIDTRHVWHLHRGQVYHFFSCSPVLHADTSNRSFQKNGLCWYHCYKMRTLSSLLLQPDHSKTRIENTNFWRFWLLAFSSVMAIKVHGSVVSPAVLRVFACLAEKELESEYVPINMGAGEHKKESFLALNVRQHSKIKTWSYSTIHRILSILYYCSNFAHYMLILFFLG